LPLSTAITDNMILDLARDHTVGLTKVEYDISNVISKIISRIPTEYGDHRVVIVH